MSEYDAGILTLSEHQAALLRRRAARELINDAEPDWLNIAEEIEDVGSNRSHAVESLLVQVLRPMLMAEPWPDPRGAPVWRADAIDFRRQARRRFVPSMQRKIDLAGLYADARDLTRNIGRSYAVAGAGDVSRDAGCVAGRRTVV